MTRKWIWAGISCSLIAAFLMLQNGAFITDVEGASPEYRGPASAGASTPQAYFTTVTRPKIIGCSETAILTITNYSELPMVAHAHTLKFIGSASGTDYAPHTHYFNNTCGSPLGHKASCSVEVRNTGIRLQSPRHVATTQVSVEVSFEEVNAPVVVRDQIDSSTNTNVRKLYVTWGSCS